MKLLLDTHIFLWFVTADERLPLIFRDTIRHPDNQVYLSVVSDWEILVKHQIGKLPLPEPPELFLVKGRESHQIASLSLDEASVIQLNKLPLLHRDPFDRMLICQAIQHDLSLVTVDEEVRQYPARFLKLS